MIVANDCLILQILRMRESATREEVPMGEMNRQQAEREAQRMHAIARNWLSVSGGPCAQMGPPSRFKGFTCTVAPTLGSCLTS